MMNVVTLSMVLALGLVLQPAIVLGQDDRSVLELFHCDQPGESGGQRRLNDR